MEQSYDLLKNDLQVTSTTETYLTDIARWGKFLAIMGFIFSALIAFFSFFMSSYVNNGYSSVYTVGQKTGIIVVYLIVALIMFFPSLFLFRFSVKMQQALKGSSQELLENAFKDLKSMFTFQGIVAIIVLGLWIISIIGLIAKGM